MLLFVSLIVLDSNWILGTNATHPIEKQREHDYNKKNEIILYFYASIQYKHRHSVKMG